MSRLWLSIALALSLSAALVATGGVVNAQFSTIAPSSH
jgi:hypothetical protein